MKPGDEERDAYSEHLHTARDRAGREGGVDHISGEWYTVVAHYLPREALKYVIAYPDRFGEGWAEMCEAELAERILLGEDV